MPPAASGSGAAAGRQHQQQQPGAATSSHAPAPIVSRTGTTGRTTPIAAFHPGPSNPSANSAAGIASSSSQQHQQAQAGADSRRGRQPQHANSSSTLAGMPANPSQHSHHHHHPANPALQQHHHMHPQHPPSQQQQSHHHHHHHHHPSSAAGPSYPGGPPSGPAGPHLHSAAAAMHSHHGQPASASAAQAQAAAAAAAAAQANANTNAADAMAAVGGSVESHNATIRSVIERGNQLNLEAAREQNFDIDRKSLYLPRVLAKLEEATDGCITEIGNIALHFKDYEKSFKYFSEALAKNPLYLPALVGLMRFYHERENYTKVVEYCERAIALEESTVAAAAADHPSSEINKTEDRDLTTGSSTTTTVHSGELWSALGHSLLIIGHLQRAYSCYQQAIAKTVKKDDPKLWYGIGILYDRYGSMEHAEEAFASVLKLDPNFHKREEIYFRLGIIYKLQGRAEASLDCFHYIMNAPPPPLKDGDVWYQIGHALELKRDLAASRDAYERVLRTTPDHSKVLQHLGGLYLRENTNFHDPEKCIKYITASLEHDSSDPFSWYLLGRAFMQLSNYGKAYEAYQQAVYRDGKNPAYWCSIGVLYFNINQFHDALDAYTRAVRIHPFIPEIWQNLGLLYESCHDQLADATDAYQRAVQLDPSNTQLMKRLNEVKNALMNGTSMNHNNGGSNGGEENGAGGSGSGTSSPPPPPMDIMPDSKSWSSIHFDLSGAKPVYLDQRSLSAANANQHRPMSPDQPLAGGSHHPQQHDPRIMSSPTTLVQQQPHHPYPGAHNNGGPAHPGAPYGAIPSMQHGNNGLRRTSYTRPGSSHSIDQGGYPSHPGQHSHHPHHHHPVDDRPRLSHNVSSSSARAGELERGDPRRMPSGSASRPYHDRHSPPPPPPGASRHAMQGGLGSPNISPRARPLDYEYSAHTGAPGGSSSRNAPYPAGPPGAEADWERMRGRDRAAAASGAAADSRERERDGRRGAPLHSPPAGASHETRSYGREYPPLGPGGAPSSSRRPGSRGYDDAPPGPNRTASGSSRPPPNPYDYYGPPGSYPPPGGPVGSGPPPPPGYPYDPRGRYDSRYDDPRERELMHERELQHRRALEEEERRRREIDASRREMSPSRSNGDTPERRGYSGRGTQLQYGRDPPSAPQQPPASGTTNGKHRHSLTGEDGQPSPASAQQQLQKDRKRKVAGSVMLDAVPGRRATPTAKGRRADGRGPVDEDYDDADTANVLMGLAGALGGGGAGAGRANSPHTGNGIIAGAASNSSAAYPLKRPLSAVDDHPMKKQRPENGEYSAGHESAGV